MVKVDLNMYKMFNPDLVNFSDKELLEHYNKYGKNEKRIYNKKSFYDIYNGFDVKYYRKLNYDLKNMNELELMRHYHFLGKNEKMMINIKQSKFHNQLVVNKFPELDLQIYRDYNNDLLGFNDEQLLKHYENYGIRENRIINLATLLKIRYPNFDLNFYRNINFDLREKKDGELLDHYINYGFNEKRIINQGMFFVKYPDFDINYYKNFNDELIDKDNLYLMSHYNGIGFQSNERYLAFDCNSKNFSEDDVNYCCYHSRRISNFKDLLCPYNSLGKRFYICSERSFYQVYDDFDLNYYRERYKVPGSNFDVYYHYAKIGFPKRYVCNPKLKIIFFIPAFTEKIGGLMVIHNMVKFINDKRSDIYAKIFNLKNIKYENEFCNNFAKIDEVTENTIVVYPEIIFGNPLNASKVVRWILLDLGIEMPADHYMNYGVNDLIYFWGKQKDENIYFKQLTKHWFNPLFHRYNYEERSGSCFIIKKGKLIHKEINFFHDPGSIEIDGFNSDLVTLNNLFNNCKYFYCYDPNSAFLLFARFCGCIPILYPKEGMSKQEYYSNSPFFFIDNVDSGFFAYGNSFEEINKAENYNQDNLTDLISKSQNFENGLVDNFITDMLSWGNNKNTISNYFEIKLEKFELNTNNNIYSSELINGLDLGYYVRFNLDLRNFSNNELINHYHTFGKNEGRIINEATLIDKLSKMKFDINYYRNFNNDLKGMNDNELRFHFIEYGINERRIYNLTSFLNLYKNFNIRIYKKHRDLKNFSDFDLRLHFHNHGRFEKRRFK